MTFGNGVHGCLGHGNLVDVKQVQTKFHIYYSLYMYIYIFMKLGRGRNIVRCVEVYVCKCMCICVRINVSVRVNESAGILKKIQLSAHSWTGILK